MKGKYKICDMKLTNHVQNISEKLNILKYRSSSDLPIKTEKNRDKSIEFPIILTLFLYNIMVHEDKKYYFINSCNVTILVIF
jgi:hypothetical protein